MPIPDIFALPNFILTSIGSASLNLSSGSDMSFEYAPSLADGVSLAIDDIVWAKVYDSEEDEVRVIYKGVVRKINYKLGSETQEVICHGVEQLVESQPWTAIAQSYNTESKFFGAEFQGQTIQQIIDREFVGDVATWFTDIEIPEEIGDLIAGPATTFQKGFFSTLNNIIAPYPHVKWVIEYDPTAETVFPVGKLILIDTSDGRDSHNLIVGSTGGDVVDYDITQDASEASTNCRVWARGEFTERMEVLTPAWDPTDDARFSGIINFNLPTEADVDTYLYFGHAFMNTPTITISGWVGEVPLTTVWLNSDYYVNFEEGIIHWNNSEAIWVDDATGQMAIDTTGSPPALPGDWRRPVGYQGRHLGLVGTISYYYMGEDAYQKYTTAYPIANLKLRLKKVPDIDNPGESIDKPVEIDPVIRCRIPRVFEATDYTTVGDYTADFVQPVSTTNEDKVANFPGVTDPPAFQEGTNVVMFDKKQIMSFTSPFWPIGQPLPTPIAWDIVLEYTSWEELVETRTGTAGNSRYHNVVIDSCKKYTDIIGNVLIDDTSKLSDVADSVVDYFGESVWSGSINVHIFRIEDPMNIGTYYWDIPFKVGDKVTLSGNVGSPISGFDGLINSIDLSNMDKGTINLGFGRIEPKKNPFAPRTPALVDSEAGSLGAGDISGATLI